VLDRPEPELTWSRTFKLASGSIYPSSVSSFVRAAASLPFLVWACFSSVAYYAVAHKWLSSALQTFLSFAMAHSAYLRIFRGDKNQFPFFCVPLGYFLSGPDNFGAGSPPKSTA
jgi:hypothetical protein